MQTQVVLTSSQSKRLIARGIAAWQPLAAAMKSGFVAVAKGTTNGYIIEELTGAPFEKHLYILGRTAPAGADTSWARGTLPDVVFKNGKRLEGVSLAEAVSQMGPGDIFLKGANAINYDLAQAAVQIGHPTGGTLGATVGTIVSRRIRFVHPVGLEKTVPGDLVAASQRLSTEGAALGDADGLWATTAELFTEIESIETLFPIEAVPIAAGGIAGAEGAVTLALFGAEADLRNALELVSEIQKEPPFGPPTA